LGNGIRHRLDVTVGGIIEHEYFGHDGFPFGFESRMLFFVMAGTSGQRRASRFCPAMMGRV
jgi:hypothetical protein